MSKMMRLGKFSIAGISILLPHPIDCCRGRRASPTPALFVHKRTSADWQPPEQVEGQCRQILNKAAQHRLKIGLSPSTAKRSVTRAVADACRVLTDPAVTGSTIRQIIATIAQQVIYAKEKVKVHLVPGLFGENAGHEEDSDLNCYITWIVCKVRGLLCQLFALPRQA